MSTDDKAFYPTHWSPQTDKLSPQLLYEPRFRRWHKDYDCAVLTYQENVELVLVRVPPELSRPCMLCAKLD